MQERISQLQIDINRLVYNNLLYENKYEKIFQGFDNQSQTKLILHFQSYKAYKSSDLYEFSKSLIALFFLQSKNNLDFINNLNILPIFGFSSDQKNFIIAYEQTFDNISLLDMNTLTNTLMKKDLINSVAKCIQFLHSNHIYHLNIRTTSILVSQTENKPKFLISFISPFPSVDLEESDGYFPFCDLPYESIDMFMFGLFILQISQNQTLKNVILDFWCLLHEKKDENDESDQELQNLIKLGKLCTSTNSQKRPTFDYILEVLKIEPISSEFHETNFNEETFHQIIETNNSPFFILLRCHYLLSTNQKVEASKIYESLLDNCIALNNLGIYYFATDKAKSFEYFKKASDDGYFLAEINFGILIIRGSFHCFEKSEFGIDRMKGFKYVKDAALQGSVDGITKYTFDLYEFLEDQDCMEIIEKASYKMHKKITYDYYKEYLTSGEFEVKSDFTRRMEVAIDYEQPKFLNTAGVIESKKGNYVQGTVYFKKAAELGLREAQYNYAVALLLGQGCQRNVSEAAKWMEKSSQAKYIDGMFAYAMMLEKGVGVKENKLLANTLCNSASNERIKYIKRHEKSDTKYDEIIDVIQKISEE
ncbi:hypothetical protein TRFO_29263 [Tritrichomonas foetus]|uniref:Protein kinase domain-containing protein n=1 Tax=Tritrichomonas foetus TaxID=1144522 RepID=A0A1J4JY14_9EUKA|nr:hypothetical protein TRFO_29263 [Tritrichomonas foetus]|eukprot:OHT03344.1 hypothetical protein TRFO_29263 [Tritrichomonas foetus]